VKITRERRRPERLVAIVTPVARLPLSAEEETSVRHLREYLGKFDRYIIGPQNLPKEFSDFALRRFPVRHFTDRFGYNRLLMTEKFYRAFAAYEYILIYQLDCLVFSSNLEEWCQKGWDYVGAPWFKDEHDPTQGFLSVGNGGLSLRRVESALRVLNSKQLVEDPKKRARQTGRLSFLDEGLKSAPRFKRMIGAVKGFLHRYGYHNNVRWRVRQLAEMKIHEDIFWAFEAPKMVTNFRIPEPREALDFSFEMAPRYCFNVNSGRLPFGCHAWPKYDREFWETYLLK
jgi:hypothetical protein